MEEKRWTISRIADSEHHLDMVRGPDTGGLIEVCPVTERDRYRAALEEIADGLASDCQDAENIARAALSQTDG